MQRYFVPPEQFGESSVVLAGEDARHAVRVMRMKPGDECIVSDGVSREARVVIRDADPERVTADIVEPLPGDREPGWSVTVAQSLPKGDKMEIVIQKGTELGAAAFAPFQSERMIVQYDARKEAKRLERWRKIAKEAAEQAHRSRIPDVGPVLAWRELIALFPRYDAVFFCYEKASGSLRHGLRTAVRRWLDGTGKDAPAPNVLLVVGPEGGFSEREAAEAEAAGAVAVGLGRRILRTETAAMAALACLMYESGEMGGV